MPDTTSTPLNTPKQIDVLANDSDPNGDSLSIKAVGVPDQGTADIVDTAGGQRITYTPPSATFAGRGTFRYTIQDPCGATKSTDVNVIVGPVVQVQIQNNSDAEAEFYIANKLVDTLQPNGLGIVLIPAGMNQAVDVYVPSKANSIRESHIFEDFAAGGSYTMTYDGTQIVVTAN